MQDKRRRNDFASTEVGEVKGGRVTQQAFEVAYKKDSGISMQRCQEREATGGRTPRKMARLKDQDQDADGPDASIQVARLFT